MSVIRTDVWLEEEENDMLQLCRYLSPYFPAVSVEKICEHLQKHGLYKQPNLSTSHFPKLHFSAWRTVQREEKQLKKLWGNVEVPIFILPSDHNNLTLQRDFNGKSGLAFKDKLFLFISRDNSQEEIRALFTHEYNHVCRLHFTSKKEQDVTLIDSIIMEGLAEYAVYDRIGQMWTNKWTRYYDTTDLQKIWHELILPNKDMSRHLFEHDALLYGIDLYPSMAGYAVGYYVVGLFMDQSNLSWHQSLETPSEIIAQLEEET